MAVPKKKITKSVTRRRHKTWVRLNVKRIRSEIQLTTCSNCGADKQNHHACPKCGFYKGKPAVDKSKEIDKITTIKA